MLVFLPPTALARRLSISSRPRALLARDPVRKLERGHNLVERHSSQLRSRDCLISILLFIGGRYCAAAIYGFDGITGLANDGIFMQTLVLLYN